ncbi:hypothetical protein PIB30_042655 [Stylosanthes scabra]|uniref:F-box domain-containing protein n=1 Tax=Stylosanthes scabra TaxID=79078 RepID=A0ABU6RFD8_9FABA|nr:hypothetical protein [Stylosanthes scabra]
MKAFLRCLSWFFCQDDDGDDGVVESCKLAFLPDDIILEILVRLPVKTLLQFKLVCKSWRTLISSPQFAIDNLRQRLSTERHLPSRVVYCSNYYPYPRFGFLQLQPLFMKPTEFKKATDKFAKFSIIEVRSSNSGGFCHDSLVMRGSCNGLVCLHHLRSSHFWLWNPCTGSTSQQCFPCTESTSQQFFPIEIKSRPIYFGLGYDHVHDKYKLVTFHEQEDLTRIFTFGANSWTIGPNFPYPAAMNLCGNIGKFLSSAGTLNWMAKVKEKEWVILSFDMTNESFGQVSLPRLSGVDDNTDDPTLQVSMNCLCFTILKDTNFEVWMMKEYGVWESLMKISPVNDHPSREMRHLTALSVLEHRVLFTMYENLVMYDCGYDKFYHPLNVECNSDDDIQIHSIYEAFFPTYFVYHDSLVLPPQ